MTIYYNSQQEPIKLDASVRTGDQFTIYTVVGQSALAAKVYTTPPNLAYQQKLVWMQANPPSAVSLPNQVCIAWPLDLLYNEQGQLVGYLLSYLQDAVPLSIVFNPHHRTQALPQFNEKHLYHIARNLAVAIGLLHTGGYVVGDMNTSNILVTPAGMVILTNTDTFQVKVQKPDQLIIYPCAISEPAYTSPELQQKTSEMLAQLPEHDYFGLGTLIFQLLMDGIHPYQGQWLGQGSPPSIEDCIQLGYFPYQQANQHLIAPPWNAPNLDVLPMAGLIRACFIDGHHTPKLRPTPNVWEASLIQAEQTLIICDNGHYYANVLSHCPRCNIIQPRMPVEPLVSYHATSGVISSSLLPQIKKKNQLTRPTNRVALNSNTQNSQPLAGEAQKKSFDYSSRLLAVAVLVMGIICSGSLLMLDELFQFSTPWASISLALSPATATLEVASELENTDIVLPAIVAGELLTDTSQSVPTVTPMQVSNPTVMSVTGAQPVEPSPAPTKIALTSPVSPTPTGTATPIPVIGPEPNVSIDLPGGDVYNLGDPINITGTIADPDGILTVYIWVMRVEASNRVMVAHNNHHCNYADICEISQEFPHLLSGPYIIHILAQDTQGQATQIELPITVR